eukprot:Gb_14698 [translate_table: standard]
MALIVENRLPCTLEELYISSTPKVKFYRNIGDASGKTLPVEEVFAIEVKLGWEKETNIIKETRQEKCGHYVEVDETVHSCNSLGTLKPRFIKFYCTINVVGRMTTIRKIGLNIIAWKEGNIMTHGQKEKLAVKMYVLHFTLSFVFLYAIFSLVLWVASQPYNLETTRNGMTVEGLEATIATGQC